MDPLPILRLDRLPTAQAPWSLLQRWWQRLCEQIEAAITAINQAITEIADAQAAADAALTTSLAAEAAAAAALAATGTLGTATLNYGAWPGANETSVAVANTAVEAGTRVRAWFASNDSTADHTADDHKYAPLFINLTAEPDAGVGFVIYARSEHLMQGQWAVQWEYN